MLKKEIKRSSNLSFVIFVVIAYWYERCVEIKRRY